MSIEFLSFYFPTCTTTPPHPTPRRVPGVSGRLLPAGQRPDDDPDHQQHVQRLAVRPGDPQKPAGMAEGPASPQPGAHRPGVG